MTPQLSSGRLEPLLSVGDLRPLEDEFLGYAQAMLPASLEPETVQIQEQQALGLLLQKGVRALLFNPQKCSVEVDPQIEAYYDRVREQAQDKAFRRQLVGDLMRARETVAQSGQSQGLGRGLWSRIRGRKLEQIEAEQRRQQREQELAELRNRTFEAREPMIRLDDLKSGDDVVLTTLRLPYGRTKPCEARLAATVLGTEQVQERPVVLLQVIEERRDYNGVSPEDPPKQAGIVVRLLGSGAERDRVFGPYNHLKQGHPLVFMSTEGRPVIHGLLRTSSPLELDQVTINGQDIFPELYWSKDIYHRNVRRR